MLGRIEVIKVALSAGFTIAETRPFLSDVSAWPSRADRWRALADRTRGQLDGELARIEAMKVVLDSRFRCQCADIRDCEALAAGRPPDTPAHR